MIEKSFFYVFLLETNNKHASLFACSLYQDDPSEDKTTNVYMSKDNLITPNSPANEPAYQVLPVCKLDFSSDKKLLSDSIDGSPTSTTILMSCLNKKRNSDSSTTLPAPKLPALSRHESTRRRRIVTSTNTPSNDSYNVHNNMNVEPTQHHQASPIITSQSQFNSPVQHQKLGANLSVNSLGSRNNSIYSAFGKPLFNLLSIYLSIYQHLDNI